MFKRPEEIAHRLQADLGRIFPTLAGTRFSHLWRGEVAFTMDRLPHLGVREGVHFALGCNAAGLPMGTWIGHKVALELLGDPESATPYGRAPLPHLPKHPRLPVVHAHPHDLGALAGLARRRVQGH